MSPTTIPWQNPAKPRPDGLGHVLELAVAQVLVEPVRPLLGRPEGQERARWRSRGRACRRRRSRRSPRPSRWRSGSASRRSCPRSGRSRCRLGGDLGEPERARLLRAASVARLGRRPPGDRLRASARAGVAEFFEGVAVLVVVPPLQPARDNKSAAARAASPKHGTGARCRSDPGWLTRGMMARTRAARRDALEDEERHHEAPTGVRAGNGAE